MKEINLNVCNAQAATADFQSPGIAGTGLDGVSVNVIAAGETPPAGTLTLLMSNVPPTDGALTVPPAAADPSWVAVPGDGGTADVSGAGGYLLDSTIAARGMPHLAVTRTGRPFCCSTALMKSEAMSPH